MLFILIANALKKVIKYTAFQIFKKLILIIQIIYKKSDLFIIFRQIRNK